MKTCNQYLSFVLSLVFLFSPSLSRSLSLFLNRKVDGRVQTEDVLIKIVRERWRQQRRQRWHFKK